MVQMNPTVGALANNAALIATHFTAHAATHDLIVCPELCLTGYTPEDLVLSPAFMENVEREVQGLAALTTHTQAALLISTAWRGAAQGIQNALILLQGGRIAAIIPKHHLPNYGVFDEQRIFKAGQLPAPVLLKGQKLGFMTCEDMWFPDVAAHLKAQGATALIVPNASPYEEGKRDRRLDVARKRVQETELPLLYINLHGGQDDVVFDGASFAMQADGALACTLGLFCDDTASVTLTAQGWRCNDHEVSKPWPEALETLYSALKTGIRDYVLKNGFKRVLIGLSGGVDSALVATLAVDALGADAVHCVMMPTPYTAQISLDDAASLAATLGCSYEIIPITDSMQSMTTLLGARAEHGVVHENLQSRLRGLILMALSNASGALVLSTGNKSEMAVGYATLYGDMCGAYAPLKDVYKTRLYELCAWRNAQGANPVMPTRILTRAPSAELRDNQTDQDSLPPYDVLDALLTGLIEDRLSPQALADKGFELNMALRVATMLDRAEYKRRQAPPGPKTTPRAFGRERRVPITQRFEALPVTPAENA